MKRFFIGVVFVFFLVKTSSGQQAVSLEGKIIEFDIKAVNVALSNNPIAPQIILPLYDGEVDIVNLKSIKITSGVQPAEVLTFSGVTQTNRLPLKLTLTPSGLSGVYKTKDNYVFFESLDKTSEQLHFYTQSDVAGLGEAVCNVLEEEKVDLKNFRATSEEPFPVGTELRKYRMAGAAAAEMYQALGTKELVRDKIVAIVNAANLIFEVETAITFELIEETTTSMTIIFTNTTTDPYKNPEEFASASKSQSAFNTMATTGLLPKSRYDVGHTFNIVQSACYICGQAGPDPCSDGSKARGMTQFFESAPVGSITGLYVHEVGHQFRAWHTYNAMGGSASSPTFCTSGWSNSAAVEPGSGTTIMAYGDNCSSPTNYVISGANNDDYFHVKSLEQIFNSLDGTAGTCVSESTTGNTPPVASAGSDYVIPKGTPFTLTGTATDANTVQSSLTYAWEQFDVATANDQGALGSNIAGVGGYTAVNSTTAPLFRSRLPSSDASRTFPELSYILNSSNNPNDNVGEDLPQVARDINFRFTVRDNENNGGGVDSDGMIITVADSGPFSLITGNDPTLWTQGESRVINWAVNGTDQSPVNCSNVNILISFDGGVTFSSLIANTANDGAENITVPNNLSSEVRIKVEAVSNVFFDINDVDITISDGTCDAVSSTIIPDDLVTAPEGSSSFNLDMTAYGAVIPSFTGVLENTDSPSKLAYKETDGNCGGPSNSNYYDVYTFYVSQAGNYEFSLTGSFGLLLNLYNEEFIPSNVCSNWLASSAEKNPSDNNIYLTSNVSANLGIGTYQIVLSSFSTSSPSLPASYTINVSQGTVYEVLPAAGSSYGYTYLAYDTANELIKKFDADADFRTLTAGNYKVYGLSYAGSADLSTYLENTFTSFQTDINNATFCGALSANSKDLILSGCSSFPDAPAVTDIPINYGETGTLTATGCSGTVNWFETETGGNSIATGNSFTSPVLTVSKTYFATCTETCTSTSRGSGTITVNPEYCDSSGLNCTDDDKITNITLSFLSSELFSQDSECSTNGFELYDKSEVNLRQGQTYNLSLTKDTEYSDGLAVWLDFNRNGDFEASEKVWEEPSNTVATQSSDFLVPVNAEIGQMRMRVRIQYGTNVTQSCQSESNAVYGEVEDYILTIVEDEPLNPCESNITLTSPENDFSSGSSLVQAAQVITGSNKISGGSITYDAGGSVTLLPGFVVNADVENQAVFLAEIGGCE